MRIYLDCCCLQRPLDDQTQTRIKVETEAVLAILSEVQAGSITLLSSDALEYEVSRIPNEQRRDEVVAILGLASQRIEITDAVENMASSFQAAGIAPMDAIHLALASEVGADFFSTTDDKLMVKASRLDHLDCKITSLLNLVSEVIP